MMTREEWLNQVIAAAWPMFEAEGAPLPVTRAALMPPHRKMKAIGLCWHSSAVDDNAREIWVSSQLNDTMQVVATLVHELCHAALPDSVGHKAPFVKLARAMALEGKPTATFGGPTFIAIWAPILEAMEPMPGAKFHGYLVGGRRKQPSRAKKNLMCPDCGFFAKVFVDQMDWGRLRCPIDDEVLLTKEEDAAGGLFETQRAT